MNDRPYVITTSGLFLSLLHPHPDQIELGDIANQLGNICRWSGAVPKFYSVAEHSFHVCRLVADEGADARVQLEALLHDAHEAYTGDIPSTWNGILELKNNPWGYGINEVKQGIQEAIMQQLGLWTHSKDEKMIKRADDEAFAAEARIFYPKKYRLFIKEPTRKLNLKYWPPERASKEFLSEFMKITPLL